MTISIEKFFICLLVIHIIFSSEVFLYTFCLSLSGLFIFFLNCKGSSYHLDICPTSGLFQLFSPIPWLIFKGSAFLSLSKNYTLCCPEHQNSAEPSGTTEEGKGLTNSAIYLFHVFNIEVLHYILLRQNILNYHYNIAGWGNVY